MYLAGKSLSDICAELDLDTVLLSSLLKKYKDARRYCCAVCGNEFKLGIARPGKKYCEDCLPVFLRRRATEIAVMRYRTVPEYRERTLKTNAKWRHSKAGRKWYEEHYGSHK